MPRRIIGLTQKIEYLASRSKLFYWLSSHYYRNVIQNEINLANITSDDHILCIGGGICPFSAILFHQITGAEVTVIDNCEECIREARQLISRLGLGGQVHAIWQEGGNIEFSLSDFSVVHFALQVFPMEGVLSSVRKQVIPGTKLLVRRPKECLGKMYSQLTGSFPACCRHIIHRKTCNIGSTVLYIKQERLNEGKKTTPSNLRPLDLRTADTSIAFSCPVAV